MGTADVDLVVRTYPRCEKCGTPWVLRRALGDALAFHKAAHACENIKRDLDAEIAKVCASSIKITTKGTTNVP